MDTMLLESEVRESTLVEELDRDDKLHQNDARPISLPPSYRSAAPEPTSQVQSAASARILARLLSMADLYRESGSLRQAVEIYFELLQEHAETPQGHRAEERLLDVARSYERSGELRQARGIYEQLL